MIDSYLSWWWFSDNRYADVMLAEHTEALRRQGLATPSDGFEVWSDPFPDFVDPRPRTGFTGSITVDPEADPVEVARTIFRAIGRENTRRSV